MAEQNHETPEITLIAEWSVPTWVASVVSNGDPCATDEEEEMISEMYQDLNSMADNISFEFPDDIDAAKCFQHGNTLSLMGADCIPVKIWGVEK